MTWQLEEALSFIREYQPTVMDAGWCLFLGGGVLNRGYGPDLDILAYPRTTDSRVSSLLKQFPIQNAESISVADIYYFQIDNKPVEMIVQT